MKNYAKRQAKDFNILTHLYQLYSVYIVFNLITCLFYKFKFKGLENIDKKKTYIISPNHVSYFDVFLLRRTVRIPIAYMAKKELFEGKGFWGEYARRNIPRLGGFAVNREKLEVSTVRTAKEIFKTKWSLCIFPQGGIRKNKCLDEVNKGFVTMAKMSKRDILPVAIKGLEEYNWKAFRRREVVVTVGKPISYLEDEDKILETWVKEVSEGAEYQLPEKYQLNIVKK